MGVLACFRGVRVCLAAAWDWGVCGGGCGWCWPRRSVLDAVDLTGGLPSKRGGAGLVYGGARVGVRLVERGIDADAGVAFERGLEFPPCAGHLVYAAACW